jgi:hypothetical protein
LSNQDQDQSGPPGKERGQVKVADGKMVTTFGKFDCKLRLESQGKLDFTEQNEFTVLDMEPYDVTLGMTFWQDWRAQVHYEIGGLRMWKRKKWIVLRFKYWLRSRAGARSKPRSGYWGLG